MLSTSPIKNSSKVSDYFFSKDEYYFQDSIDQSWYGKGAQALGLEGDVEVEQFKMLLDGKLPNEQQLGRMVDGKLKHRPGYDLTFNAPKSVSLLAIMGQDEHLLKAHSLAVKATLSTIEQRCAQARVAQNGRTLFQTTNNLTIATFRHELSRAGDPHLHTHCIVMNATACEDGKWRSLASNRDFNTQDRYGFWEQVIHHQRYYGLIYRAELAYQLTQLGYQIRKTGDHNFFEIAGVPQVAIDAFSQRRKVIEEYMTKHGRSGAKDAAFATLATRQAKKARNQDELNQLWQERATYHGFKPEQIIEQAKSGSEIEKEVEISEGLKQMVINAIDDLAQNRNTFSEQQIIQNVFNSQPKQLIRVNDLLAVITDLNKDNMLVALPGDGSCYTTQRLIEQEQTLIKQVQDVKDTLQPILPDQHLKKWLERNPDCNAFEEKALLHVFATGHQLQGILGSNSEAQERLINRIKHLATLAEFQPIFLSRSQNRAQQLNQHYDIGVKSK